MLFTHNAWCLGFSLLLLQKNCLPLSFCPFGPFITITLCFVTFFWHFSSSLVMFNAHCSLFNSFFFFFYYVYLAPCSLLFCYCSSSNGAHNTCIVLHLVVMFNMVICLNWHLLCFVHLITTLLLDNDFCLCWFFHYFVALTTYYYFWVIFLYLILLLFQRTHNGSLLYFLPHVIIIIIIIWLMFYVFLVALCKCFSFVAGNCFSLK
jgi:hypothetical protein